ncbi:MAG: TetR/AcrR family transcriptional regulator [Lachnospiraceae bacterium]|nr:TetR/AcrR family transcriptional regulator [Lachnospiraceae bacterium]
MPPKPKYTREELIESALELTKESGIDAVVARNLGNKLGVAPSTVFTHFESIEEIRQAVLEAARKLYNGYVEEGLRMTPPMKGFGVQYIRFAIEEHNLFILLFMQKREGLKMVDFIVNEGHYERIIQAAQKDFSLEREQAELLYHNMFTYAHGIAAMSATGVCSFSLEEISLMLGMTCRSMLIGMKVPRDEREKTMPRLGVSMQGSVESYMMEGRGESK